VHSVALVGRDRITSIAFAGVGPIFGNAPESRDEADSDGRESRVTPAITAGVIYLHHFRMCEPSVSIDVYRRGSVCESGRHG